MRGSLNNIVLISINRDREMLDSNESTSIGNVFDNIKAKWKNPKGFCSPVILESHLAPSFRKKDAIRDK